jgi:hypothetical protein
MAESNFIVKNGLVVNTSFAANSTVLQANGLSVNSISLQANGLFVNSTFADVSGTANISGNTIIGGGLTSANLTTTTNTATLGTTLYSVANGNVGIGTNAPGVKLSVIAPNNTHILQLRGNSQANLPGPFFGGSISYNFVTGFRDLGFWNTDSAALTSFAFYQLTGASTYSNLMFITSGGNVGIGTSATVNARLAVSGTANVSGNTIIGGGLTSANLTTTTNTTTLGTTLYVVTGGNVGISNSAPDAKLAVTGTANISGNVVIGGLLTLGNSSLNATLSAVTFSGIGLEPTQVPRAVDLGTAAFVDIEALNYYIVNSASAAYSLTLGDNGKVINITTGGVTVNGVVLPTGFNVQVFNNSAANQTITAGAGVTMYQAGTANTGNRTLLQRGLASITCVAGNTFVISGSLN